VEDDLRADDVIIDSIELVDEDDIDELLEFELEEPSRPAPAYGSLADEGAHAPQQTVFDPDHLDGEPPEPVPIEQIEIDDPDSQAAQQRSEPMASALRKRFEERRAQRGQASPDEPDEREQRVKGPTLAERWRERFGERVEISADEEPQWGSDPGTPQESEAQDEGGLRSWLAGRLELMRAAREQEKAAERPEAAGIDVSPPRVSPLARLRGLFSRGEQDGAAAAGSGILGKVFGEAPAEAGSASITQDTLQALLTPLSDSEVKRLQAEVAAEEPIFVQIERARAGAVRHQTLAFYLGLAVLVAFFAVYQTSYLTEILPQVEIPDQIAEPPTSTVPADAWRDGIAAVFFGVGLLLPFLAFFTAVEGIRRLLSLTAFLHVGDLILGCFGLVAAMGALLSLAEAQVLLAAGWLAGFAVIRALYRGWEERRGRYG